MNKAVQKGFTLIELMIVVAIIGILAAIAIPQYQNYVARSQFSEAPTLLSAAQTTVEERYLSSGNFPDSHDGTDNDSLEGLGVRLEGAYGSINSAEEDSDAGTFSMTYEFGADDQDVNADLAGESVTFQRDDQDEWTCLISTDEISQFATDACQEVDS